MEICNIEGATRILGAPQDWDKRDTGAACQSLPIVDRPDGWMVSQWKPSAEELTALAGNSSLFLWVYGTVHPVVGLSVVDDAGNTAGEDAPMGVVQELAARNAEVKLLRMTIKRMQETLADQGRMCSIALAATGEPEE